MCCFLFISDVVTCLAIDNGGRHLITGSRDTTCRVWTVAHYGGWAVDIDKVPLQILYGHDREITCVAINWELDMVVSGSAVSVTLNTCISYGFQIFMSRCCTLVWIHFVKP